MSLLTRRERLELILTYYLLWKIKTERRFIRKIVRFTAPRAITDLSGASIGDLGTKDHDLLDGLLDDDHTQYPLLLGRAGGQTLIGGTASGDDLTFESTSHATKGSYFFKGHVLCGPATTLQGYLGNASYVWGNAQIQHIQFSTLASWSTTGVFYARNLIGAEVWFRTLFGGVSTAARLVTEAAGSAAWYIDRAGDIVQLVGKTSALRATTLGDGGTTDYVDVEADGDTIFVGGAGLCYGCISVVGNAANTVIAGAGTKAQFLFFDTDSAEHNTDADHTNDHITITKTGTYYISCSTHVESDGAGGADTMAIDIYKNNGTTFVDPLHGHRRLAGGGGDVGSMTISGIAALSVNDTIELWITNDTSGDDLLVADASLSVVQIGG